MLTPDDIIYMIVTDRFEVGDRSRNLPLDPANPMGRHGGNLLGITRRLPYLKDLGVTALWTTPVYRNPPESYHGYHPVDFESVDPYLCSDELGPPGDRRNVRRFVEIAHEHGLKVMLDMIVSHTAIGHEWTRDRRDWINWSGDTPDKAWFKGLPNIDHDNVDVNVYFVRSLMRWLKETRADAVRIDAARHVETQFWDLYKLYWHTVCPDTTVIGEFWDGNPHCLSPFQNLYGLDSMFDFPLYHAIRDVFIDDYPFARLARPRLSAGEMPGILDLDACYRNAYRLVTFIGNHDTSRFFEAAGGASRPDEAFARMRLALIFLMTSRGIPQLYYGDELAMAGGYDPDNRGDMPWNVIDPAVAQTDDPAATTARRMHAFTRSLTALRHRSRALRYGLTVTLYLAPGFYAFARCLLDELVVVALNNAPQAVEVTVPVRQNPRLPSLLRNQLAEGLAFSDELTGGAKPELRDGGLRLRLPPRSGAVYRAVLPVQHLP
jgi:glycosidase